MNIKEYISSGIVESYVLGLATDAERSEFEQLCAQHPELLAASEAFELSLERAALADAVPPPAFLKERLLSATLPLANSASAQSSTPAKVVKIGTWVRYLAAASVVLLIASTALNFYFFNEYKSYSTKYADLLASQTELANNNKALQTKLSDYENTIAMFRNPAMNVIKMEGNKVPNAGSPDPSSMATILWDSRSKDVFLLINSLPAPSADQQYQLWAIVDGKPVDAGVFDINNLNAVLKMKNIPQAQAFAVTLEKKGGSQQPEGKMYVLGSI